MGTTRCERGGFDGVEIIYKLTSNLAQAMEVNIRLSMLDLATFAMGPALMVSFSAEIMVSYRSRLFWVIPRSCFSEATI